MADGDKSAEPPAPNATVARLQVGLGVGLVFLGHGLLLGLLLLGVWSENRFHASGACLRWSEAALEIGVVGLLALPVTQLVYVVPLFVAAPRVRPRIARGVVLAAALTVLVQGALYWVAWVPRSSVR